MTLLGETCKILHMASYRIIYWAITLSAYQYTIRYKAGKQLNNADALSRLPRPVSSSRDSTPAEVIAVINHVSSSAVDARTYHQGVDS